MMPMRTTPRQGPCAMTVRVGTEFFGTLGLQRLRRTVLHQWRVR
jgi:hypothetical protein